MIVSQTCNTFCRVLVRGLVPHPRACGFLMSESDANHRARTCKCHMACHGLCAGAPTPGCALLCPFLSRATVSSDSGRTMACISSGASLSLVSGGDEFCLWNQIGSTKFEVFCFLLIFQSRPYNELTAGWMQRVSSYFPVVVPQSTKLWGKDQIILRYWDGKNHGYYDCTVCC